LVPRTAAESLLQFRSDKVKANYQSELEWKQLVRNQL